MRLYPVFLSLEGRRVLVAGAGKVGARKIAGLREAGAGDIIVFDPCLSGPEREELETLPGVRAVARGVTEGDLAGNALVFAATNDPAENRRIAALCRALGIFCNVADGPEAGSFHVPACARVDELTAAFSTGGRSPALAARISRDARDWRERDYMPLLVLLRRLRPRVLAMDGGAAGHGELLRSLVRSALGPALARKDMRAARSILEALLPPSLHGDIEEFLDGL
ncbi:MAG: NAD(P)-dependent oxidoreductase [Deltaproteobacteria bacterium]|nr:NAD(P)-dependent oxidoreductase [Deltaproteobacteria bacterium]